MHVLRFSSRGKLLDFYRNADTGNIKWFTTYEDAEKVAMELSPVTGLTVLVLTASNDLMSFRTVGRVERQQEKPEFLFPKEETNNDKS